MEMTAQEIVKKANDKTLQIGFKFNFDSSSNMSCSGSSGNKVKFSGTYTTLEAWTDLYIPSSLRVDDLGRETVRDVNTGKVTERSIRLEFWANLEYQSDYNFYVFQVDRREWCKNTEIVLPFECYNMGMMTLTGKGRTKNLGSAIECFNQGASLDHPLCKQKLAELGAQFNSSKVLSTMDFVYKYLGSNPEMEKGMTLYKEGRHLEALFIFEDLGNKGNATAQMNCGLLFYKGEGIEKDYAKAVEWFQKAAEQDHAPAQCILGTCYRNGYGVEQNYDKAFELINKSASQGEKNAMDEMGYCYRYGHGVEKDINKAIEWFQKALANGSDYAKKNLSELEAGNDSSSTDKKEDTKPAASSETINTSGKAMIELKRVGKSFKGGVRAVNNINFTVKEKEFVVLLGPSGCGKSTILRLIAGHEDLTDGDILIDGEVINKVPVNDRNVFFVPQDYMTGEGGGLFGAKSKERLNRGALVMEMRVYDNMAFDLENKRVPKMEIDKRINAALKVLDSENLTERNVKALASGQKWKIALGRAMVRNPKVYLFDDPFSAVDPYYKSTLMEELVDIFNNYVRKNNNPNASIIFATRDKDLPGLNKADRIINMMEGSIK